MSKRFVASVAALAAVFMLMAGYLVSAGSIGAQGADATPEGESVAHPAHIHSGTCDELGDVVFPLNDLTATDLTASPETVGELPATPAISEEEMLDVVAESATTVEASLSDIISGEHAINVHESAENIQNYIACGDITGQEMGGLQIDLDELNDSGYRGIANLTDNGDNTTTVTVVLMRGDAGTPVATPAS